MRYISIQNNNKKTKLSGKIDVQEKYSKNKFIAFCQEKCI